MLFFNVIKNPKIVKKNGFGGGLWIHLGRVWDGLGRLLGAFGCFLAAFGAFQIDLFSSMGARWAPKGLGDRSWVDFGRVWEGFWEDVEGLLDALGRFLWGRIWLGPRFADFWTSVSWKAPLNYFGSETPALPRQLAWRHNFQIPIRFLKNANF